MVNQRVVNPDAVLRTLDGFLLEAVNCTPCGLRNALREVQIWIEEGDASELIGLKMRRSDVGYFPLDATTRNTSWFLPEKAGGIEIHTKTLTEPWARWRAESNPGWLFHEFAHAMHDQILGFDCVRVRTTYDLAMKRKLYDVVETRTYSMGNAQFVSGRGAAYARTDYREYFAELSVAYFGLSHSFFPFTRDDLQKHDGAGFELVDSFWRSTQYTVINGMSDPIRLCWVGENARKHRLFDIMPNQKRSFCGWSRLNMVGEDVLTRDEYKFARPKTNNSVWRIVSDECPLQNRR